MKTIIALLVLVAGCVAGDNADPPAQMYQCLIRYRCDWDDIIAREYHHCAADVDEASQLATDVGFALMAERCQPNKARWVRVACEAYDPQEECTP